MEHRNIASMAGMAARLSRIRALLLSYGLLAALGQIVLVPVTVAQAESFNSQPSAAQATRILTGQGEREWVLSRWEPYMGDDQECNGGESYIFYRAGTLVVRRCVDDMLENQTRSWMLRKASGHGVEIVIDNLAYDLRFFKTDEGIKMRQHNQAGAITDKAADRWFFYPR